jgi:hypothetical protein
MFTLGNDPADPSDDPADEDDVVAPLPAPTPAAAPASAIPYEDPAEPKLDPSDSIVEPPSSSLDPAEAEVVDEAPRLPRKLTPPRADPYEKVRNATTVGAAAGGATCLGGCVPLLCASACPPAIVISPATACCGGTIASVVTHLAINEPESQQPIVVGALTGVGVLLGALAGGGVGLTLSLLEGSDPTTGGLVGIALGAPTLGVLGGALGGAVVDAMKPDESEPAGPLPRGAKKK